MECVEAATAAVIPTIGAFGQRMLGLEMRVFYQKEVFIHPSEELDGLVERMHVIETEAGKFRERIRARLGELTNTETVFLEESPVFLALARMVCSDRKSAYSTLCNALWVFGQTANHRPNVHGSRTISDWGGWPRFEGVPECEEEGKRYWFLLTMALQPKSETEWQRFVSDSSCFVYSLMLRHGGTPDFWNQLHSASHGAFRNAVARHRRDLLEGSVHF